MIPYIDTPKFIKKHKNTELYNKLRKAKLFKKSEMIGFGPKNKCMENSERVRELQNYDIWMGYIVYPKGNNFEVTFHVWNVDNNVVKDYTKLPPNKYQYYGIKKQSPFVSEGAVMKRSTYHQIVGALVCKGKMVLAQEMILAIQKKLEYPLNKKFIIPELENLKSKNIIFDGVFYRIKIKGKEMLISKVENGIHVETYDTSGDIENTMTIPKSKIKISLEKIIERLKLR